MEDFVRPAEGQKDMQQWLRWHFEQLFPPNMTRMLVAYGRSQRRRQRARGGRSKKSAQAFARKIDRLKSDAELRTFVYWKGKMIDLMRVYVILTDFENRMRDMDPNSPEYLALHNRMVMNQSLVHACRLHLDWLAECDEFL